MQSGRSTVLVFGPKFIANDNTILRVCNNHCYIVSCQAINFSATAVFTYCCPNAHYSVCGVFQLKSSKPI